MNFIELKTSSDTPAFVNLSLVTCILQDPNGKATVCFEGGEGINLNERYDDVVSTIETIQIQRRTR